MAMIDPDFDLDSTEYLWSSLLYILFCGLIGVVFLLVVAGFLIARYLCGCCGGKNPPREGFNRSQINDIRLAMAFFSFFLEGCLIYGYFANDDLDSSMWTLVERFVAVGQQIKGDFAFLVENLPENCGDPVYDNFSKEFKEDLNFSARYAELQSNVMNDYLERFERARMLLLLLNLGLATVGCAIGIAAGSISRAWPMWLMLGCNSVSAAIIFFSAGAHFAGSKVIFEYCDEIGYYLEEGNLDLIPMRLQYFVPCVSSPVFPFISRYFIVQGVSKVDALVNAWRASSSWNDVRHALPMWFNVSDQLYVDLVQQTTNETLRDELEGYRANASHYATLLQTIDGHQHCAYTKSVMRDEQFLFCTYMKDNMDMMTASQVVGAVLLAVVTGLGIPAIKQFAYAGKAHLGGVLNGNRGGGGPQAKAKRKA
jgi:hypothetical protein